MAGGGSSTTTSTAAIDPDIKAAVLPAIQKAGQAFNQDYTVFGKVAGQEGQKQALAEQELISKLQRDRKGVFDDSAAIQRDLQNLQGQQLAGSQGSLGSARADRARQSALADKSLQLNQLAQNKVLGAQKDLQNVAAQRAGLDQQFLDRGYTSAQRYFGLLSGAPQDRTQTQTGPSGGK